MSTKHNTVKEFSKIVDMGGGRSLAELMPK